jgi:hypothetical protein
MNLPPFTSGFQNVEVPSAYRYPEGKENTGGMCWNSSLALSFVTPCSPRIISILRLPGVGLAEYPLENSKKEIIPRRDITLVALPIPYAISTPSLLLLLHTSPKALIHSRYSLPSIFSIPLSSCHYIYIFLLGLSSV